jgi:hypothetical protein
VHGSGSGFRSSFRIAILIKIPIPDPELGREMLHKRKKEDLFFHLEGCRGRRLEVGNVLHFLLKKCEFKNGPKQWALNIKIAVLFSCTVAE